MLKIYGAVRVSTKRQNLERQIRNILDKYPNAYIVKETYTGTTLKGNKELDKLVNYINHHYYPLSNNENKYLNYISTQMPYNEHSDYYIDFLTDDYFDYDTMGFGPATYDYEQTVDVLIKCVKI